jgi:hypothetical protein
MSGQLGIVQIYLVNAVLETWQENAKNLPWKAMSGLIASIFNPGKISLSPKALKGETLVNFMVFCLSKQYLSLKI